MKNKGFFDKVYEITKLIPFGKVTSYGAIANYLGTPGSARMVGWALNASSMDPSVPAHRVVNRKGILTGKHHFDGSNLMQQLLESEKINIKKNTIVDLKNVFWNPNIELNSQ